MTIETASLYQAAVKQSPTLRLKRVFDVLCVLLAMPFWAPVMLLLAILIRIDSRGSIFFRQERSGLEGQVFHIYKFRTMHQHVCDNDSGEQSIKQDVRHTRLGKWLRRSSLDELPQLFNVLAGDMSLVGPRPHARYHDQVFMQRVPTYHQRFRVRPGITGLAQVQGKRGLLESDEQLYARVKADNEYIEQWSFWLDIKILFKTVLVVFKAINAH